MGFFLLSLPFPESGRFVYKALAQAEGMDGQKAACPQRQEAGSLLEASTLFCPQPFISSLLMKSLSQDSSP